ncbi:zinc-binding alcohol dehydrogenase family protein [Winogradskya consettensis]|uniref:Zinc-binding dehydrogenase n=1 Tax=Winogradskya consettensis TaxID=113560 RepID=A0A919SA27_9ACTN|nr:zinc-binding alcohol dehydrogenase family protein [Actinoplanes consettensis]GIM67099.1 zinc-binding dehydrogenase [Actinoplanes consettensis]
MHAAVVTSFDEPPHYQEFSLPQVHDPDVELVDVLAVGLHPRVRSGASGRHYTSTGALPLIPGIDGVARRPDGTVVYFVADDDLPGSMAEQTLIDVRRTVPLPPTAHLPTIAAAMNPAMSSWVALRRRVPLQKGQSVLVLGATGNAGAMAVQIARHLGAGQVIAAGRSGSSSSSSSSGTSGSSGTSAGSSSHGAGTDAGAVLPLDPDALAEAAKDVDIVLDYLWGKPAQEAMTPILKARADRSKALDWIQIGSVAGPTIELPSVVLRSANFRILGNGQGAVSTRGYLAELPALIDELTAGSFGIRTRTVPLSDVTQAWQTPGASDERVVLIP